MELFKNVNMFLATTLLLLVCLTHTVNCHSVIGVHHENEIDDDGSSLAQKNLMNGRADVVFLLDRSGSVGSTNFEIMRGFVESLLTHVVVDENATRVAVISYSNTAETHLNYIRDPKTKCFLSEEMQDIAYKDSEATNIAAALNEAKKVLLHSRPNVNKVVIMISDGLATLGGDPVPVGDKLKKDTGAEVFAFGIGRFLKQELQAIATSPGHVYSCKGFREFKRLARKIRGDPHESSWSSGSTPSCDHLCDSPYKGDPNDPGCCDHHARCSCALLSGMHSCACSPGYFGLKGTWGDCRACPRGTFKSRLEPAGSCVDCPPGSTTAEIASTSIRDCHCKDGFTGDPTTGQPCKPVTCPPLQNPTDGLIVGDCDNHYGSECFAVCRENYELKDKNSQAMKCQSNGRWSSNAPTCQRIKCHSPIPPRFGRLICDAGELVPGKRCHSRCFDGFILQGSKMRECLSNKKWSGVPAYCIRTECPIPQQPKHGRLVACNSKSKPQYGDMCVFKCNYGYRLVGSSHFKCDQNGNLVDSYYGQVHGDGVPYCQDTEPPEIRCPRERVLETKRGRAYAIVDWENENLPEAHDNSGDEVFIKSNPPGYTTGGKFPIGTTTITFEASDQSGLTSYCEFSITVIDREPPQVLRCPDTVQRNTTHNAIRAYWDEPVFKDNSNEYYVVKRNHQPGDHFPPGIHNVFYVVRDQSDNAAMCEFQVIVTQHYCPNHAPPINGALVCEDWMYGQFCQVQCNQKYDFEVKPADWYVCNEDAKWSTLPEGMKIPWPSCTKTVLPHQVTKMWVGYYYPGDCRDPRVQDEIRMAFLTVFRKKFGMKFCVGERSCSLDMVKITCGKVIDFQRQPHLRPSTRSKRDTWRQIPETAETLEIELDIIIDDESNENVIFDFLDAIENLEWNVDAEISELLSHAASANNGGGGINNNNDNLDEDLVLRVIAEDIMLVCGVGSELHSKECRLCPFGTYHDMIIDKCSPCAIGYYQDTEGQVDCKACPPGTSTKYTRSTNETECRGICRDGTYSSTGVETCLACPVGTYQDQTKQTSCIPCPSGHTTETEASRNSSDCKKFCTAGHYSESGLEPCIPCPLGTFQEQGSQTECVECPTHLRTRYRGSSSRNDCIVFDPCEDYCQNGGECAIIDRNPVCSCGTGYHGSKCETDIDECNGKPCHNGGECINTNGSFFCNCSSGYEGDICEVKSSPCEPNPCLNNATSCVETDDVSSFECICSGGYAGTYCEVAVEQCTDDLIICQNGGVCFNDSCSCTDGFAGVDCSINVDDCYNVTCHNGGSCLDGLASFTCMCDDGFTGQFCETDIDDCENNDCYNGSLCRDLVGGYRCLCPPGWSGRKCEDRLSSDFILSFPDNSSLGNMASVRLLPSSPSEPLSELTVSMWVQTSDVKSSIASEATPLSYAYARAESNGGGVASATVQLTDNALTISDCSDLVVYINNEPIVTEVNIADGKWHHFAFTWSSDSGEWRAYKDGYLESNGTGFQQNRQIPTGGLLVLGQDQDEIGGGFSPLQTFTGNLTRLNIWGSSMSDSDIQLLCRKEDEEHVTERKVMAWPDVLEGVSGDVGVLLDYEDKKTGTNEILDQ